MDELDRRTTAQLIVALIAFGLSLGAYLTLALTGHDADALVRTAVILGSVFGFGTLGAAGFRRTHKKLDQVAHQTNGQLDQRLEAMEARLRTAITADPAGTPPEVSEDLQAPPRTPSGPRGAR